MINNLSWKVELFTKLLKNENKDIAFILLDCSIYLLSDITHQLIVFLIIISCPDWIDTCTLLYYRNIYCNERLWLKLWARGDCNCPSAKYHNCSHPKNSNEGCIYLFYIRYSYIHCSMIGQNIPKKIRIFIFKYNVHLVFRRTGNGCVQHVWFTQNSALTVCLACVLHKRTIIARIIYVLEKTIYILKKTIYGLERLFMALNRLFTALSLFLLNS